MNDMQLLGRELSRNFFLGVTVSRKGVWTLEVACLGSESSGQQVASIQVFQRRLASPKFLALALTSLDFPGLGIELGKRRDQTTQPKLHLLWIKDLPCAPCF